MLSRRHIRIKAMQAVYGFFVCKNTNLKVVENNLLKNLEQTFDLYLYQISLLVELLRIAKDERLKKQAKHFPTKEDLKPETNFTENTFLNTLYHNKKLSSLLQQKAINWQLYADIPNILFKKISHSDVYIDYIKKNKLAVKNDCDFLLDISNAFIFNSEMLNSHYEDINMHWADDIFIVNYVVAKQIADYGENQNFEIAQLYKNEKEDKQFAQQLLRKTLLNSKQYGDLIKSKTQNWEMERIALIDMILMKMAISEMLEMPDIPAKVSLNEYIELSKMFSTPKSKLFINGVLDKLLATFRAENRLKKAGKGLIEG